MAEARITDVGEQANIGARFLECVDVLEKIKRFKEENSKGLTKHHYTVKNLQNRELRSTSTPRIRSSVRPSSARVSNQPNESGNANEKYGTESHRILPKLTLPPIISIRRKDFFDDTSKLRDKQHALTSRDTRIGREAFLKAQLEPISMAQVDDPTAQSLHKTQWKQRQLASSQKVRQPGFIKAIRIGTSGAGSEQNSILQQSGAFKGDVTRSHGSANSESAMDLSVSEQADKDLGKLKLLDAVQLELGIMQEDSALESSRQGAGKWKKQPQFAGMSTEYGNSTLGSGDQSSGGVIARIKNSQNSIRLAKFARRSFLRRVLESTQITPPPGSKFTQDEILHKQDQLFESVAERKDHHLFEDFLNGFGDMVRLFGNFRVKEIFNFKEFPLERFGQPPDPHRDIIMRLEKCNKAMSRWIDSAGKVSWRPCKVEKYDKITGKFTINWIEGYGSTKQVSRLNIVLDGEDITQFDQIKKKATAVRCQYLLDQSIKDTLLSKDSLANCRVYFGLDQFKQLIMKSNLNEARSESAEFTAGLAQEILEEYALGILRFFAIYKSSPSFDHFVDQLGGQGGHSLGYTYVKPIKQTTKLEEYIIFESTTSVFDQKLEATLAKTSWQAQSQPEMPKLIGTWGRTPQGTEYHLDEQVEGDAKLITYGEKLFFKAILEHSGYNLSDDQILKLFTEKQTSENMLLKRVDSEDSIAPKSALLDAVTKTEQEGPLVPPAEGEDPKTQPEEDVPVVLPSMTSISTITMATCRSRICISSATGTTASQRNSLISPHIYALGRLIAAQFLDPLDLQLGHMALCHSAITDIEQVDVFSTFGGRQENQFELLLKSVAWVQENFGLLRDEYLSLLDNLTEERRMEMSTRFLLLSKCLNHQLRLSTDRMLENSSVKLGQFLQKIALTINIEREFQEQIDFLLAKETYILKCRGQIRYEMQPDHQEGVIHPRMLERYSGFRRRVALFMSYAGYYMNKIVANDLKVQQRIISGSQLFGVTLATLKVHQKTSGKSSKKMDNLTRQRIRAENRERIYSMQEFFEQKYDSVVKEILLLPTATSMEFNSEEFRKLETNHVVAGILGDFNCEFGMFEFKPSLSKIEKDLKESIRECLLATKTIPRLGTGKDLAAPDSSPIKTPPSLPRVIFSLDSLLSDTLVGVMAFMYTLQSFGHLLPTEKSLLHEELKQLIDNDNLDPLETEVHQLLRDKKMLENLVYPNKDKTANTKYTVGPFAVDCQDISKTMLANVEDCIKKVFEPHVYKKFDSLIAHNKEEFQKTRERLLSPVTDIERYIEMKRFVEGEELTTNIEKIRHDIKLCRRLNTFEEETRFMSDLISNDYLESLSWVTELTHLQESAQARIKKALPQFKEELVKIQERLTKEFEQTKILMKEFETYSEDQEAEAYHLKARELNASLENYLQRALDLNNKQEIIGVKKSNLDVVIQNEKVNFSKYLDLWSFIDSEWNIKHESWKKEPFYKLDKAEMATVIGNGLALLRRLQESFKDNDVVTKLVRTKQNEVNKFNKVLDVVKILKDPSFKDRHWDDLFQHIKESDNNDVLGLKEGRPDLTKITLGQLMLANIVSYHQVLKMIEIKANMESDIELRIKKIRQSVESIVIKPTIFDLDGSGLSIITRIREICMELNEHLSTCFNMLSNPECPEELVKELRMLANLLTITTKALAYIQSVQQKLIRFSPIFKFKELERFLTRKDTTSHFLKLREEFRKVLATLEEKKIGFFTELVTSDDEDSKEGAKAAEFLAKLQSFNTTSDLISQSLTTFFKMIRLQSPRYFYTTDEQMLTLCSLIKFPRSFIGFVTTLFRGLRSVTTGNVVEGGESDSVEIISVTNMMGEVMKFPKGSVIDLATNAEIPLISIVKELERQTAGFLERERRNSLTSIANLHFDFGMIYHHWNDKHITWQTMSVCVQALFDLELSMILRNSQTPPPVQKGFSPITPNTRKSVSAVPVVEKLTTPAMLKSFKQRLQKSLYSFVQYPVRYLKDKLRDSGAVSNFNGYILMVQGLIDVLDYIELSEVQTHEDFAYQMIPKYSMTFLNEVKTDPITSSVVEDGLDQDVIHNLRHPSVVRNEEFTGCYTTFTPIVEEYMVKKGQKLILTMMGHSLDYKYEVLNVSRHTNPWPLLERTVFSMWLAMCTCPHIIMRGYKNQGKLETLRALNQRIAANYFECDMSFGNDVGLVSQYIYGMISGGYWLVFKNMEKAPSEVLSIMASFANEIRQSVAAKRTKIRLNDQELLIMGSHLILCTYNITNLDSSRKFEELSTNITDQFRIVTIHAPNFHQIISSLVSGVFDSEPDKASWVNKLLFFCKTYQQAEINTDIGSDARGTLMTEEEQTLATDAKKLQKGVTQEKEYLVVPTTGLEEVSTVSKLPDILQPSEVTTQQQMPDISLREICNLITRSLAKYYKALHMYYETFKEKDGTYRIDLQILQLNQERTAKFTQIFRAEVLGWLQNYNPSHNQAQAQKILFEKLFAEDLARMRTHMGSGTTASHKEMLTKLLATFRELEPRCNLPEDDRRVVKLLEGYADAYLSSESGQQVIVCGEPNTQKSTLIKLLGLLESELTNCKFSQYWLNLESLAGEDVFGNTKSPGILREILLQTNNINLEEKTTATKLKYLFENSTDLYSTQVDHRLNKDGKVKKTTDKQNSWIVVDANSSKNNTLFASRVNYLLRIFSNLYEMKEVNQFIGFSTKLRIVYEMNSLVDIEPASVSDACVLYVRQGFMTTEDRISQWAKELSRQHIFFKMVMPKVTDILTNLILPLVVDLEEEIKQPMNKPAFSYPQRLSFLNSILGHLEIFLNEFRKMYIALGLLEVRRNPDSDTALQKLSAGPQVKTNKPEQFSFGSGMKLAQETGVSMIGQQRSKKITLKREDDHVSGLKTLPDIEEFERRKIEGLSLFCFVTAAYPQLFCDQYLLLKAVVERQGAAYCTKKSVNKNLFADGLFSMIADKKLGGITVDLSHFLYDFTKGRWVAWESVKIPNKVEVSSSFTSEEFKKNELTRLNCQNTDTYFRAEASANEEVFTFINSVEKSLVPTSNTNQMRYMLDLLLNYKRHVLLMSDHQQGKSSFLGNVYFRDLIEYREIITFNFVLQKGVTSKIIQTQMEENLLGTGRNVVRPPQNKRVVVWIDDLQMSNDEEKPESLVRSLQVQGGWFSSNKKTFIKIEDCQFLMTFSGTEYNREATRMNVSALNPDVLCKSMLFKTHKMSLSEVTTVFFDQVKSNVDPSPSSESDKLISKLFHQLSKVVFFNQDTLKSLSSNSLVNLTVDSFNQLTRSMGLVDWEELSEKPADVLFAWYKTLMSFLSCDFNFQKAEFEILMKEKHAKMDLIKTTRKSSLFQTVKNQRLSVKLNAAVLQQLQAQFSGPAGTGEQMESSNSLGANKAALLRKSSRLSIMPTDMKKISDMQQIKEEDHEDQEDDDELSQMRRSVKVSADSPKGGQSISRPRGSQRGGQPSEQASPSSLSISEAQQTQRQKSKTLSITKSIKPESTSRHHMIEKHGLVLRVLQPDGVASEGIKSLFPKVEDDQRSQASSQRSRKKPYASPSGVVLSTKRSILEKSASLLVDPTNKPSETSANNQMFYSPKMQGRSVMKSNKSDLKDQQRRLSSNLEPPKNTLGQSQSRRGSLDQGSRKSSAHKEDEENDSQVSRSKRSSSSSLDGSRSNISQHELKAEEGTLGVEQSKVSVTGSARDLLVPGSPKSQFGGSQRSIGAHSAAGSQVSQRKSKSSSSHSSSAESPESPEEEPGRQDESPEEGSIDEQSDDAVPTDETKAAFRIDPLLPTNVFFRKFIEKTMDFKLPGRTKLDELARSSCFDMKFIFDQNLLKEMKDSKERKEDADEHTFYVPDARGEQELMEFFKAKVLSFVRTHPDALLWLKLDGGNFPLFVHHFSMLSMGLLTDFQQLFISAVKSLHYAKAVVQFIGSTLGVQVDYIDLLAGNLKVDESGGLTKADAYEHLKDVIINTFADVWRLKKRIIIIHIPNSSVNIQNRKLLDRVLELISSLVMNTDSIQTHLGEHLKEMVDSAKKDKLYQHYSEFELRFTIRNRFQAKTIFVLLNDSTQTYMPDSSPTDSAQLADQVNNLYTYMTDNFSKLTAKFSKLVLNGLKCLEPSDTPGFFQPLLRIEEAEMDASCARHLNTELNFLRCVDLEKEYFSLVRPFTENVVLYKACRNAIRLRLSVIESEHLSPECERDKNLIIQRIEKRKEVLALEIKEIDSQIETKYSEKEGVLAQEAELKQRRENWSAKRNDCAETIEKLQFSMAELIKEEGLYQDLKVGLQETLKSIREFRDKDLVQGVHAGYFTKSRAFAVYSVVFCELSKQMVVDNLTEEELYNISEESIDRSKVQDYTTIFEDTIANFGSKFVDAIGALAATSISEKKCRFFCSLIEKMRVGIEDPTIVSQMQRAVIRVIDTCIESIRLEQEKERRESEMTQLRDSISMLEAQLDRCSSFLNLIDKELAEQPELVSKIESRVEHLKKLKQTDLACIQTLSDIVQNLVKYQADFEKITQPMSSKDLNKDELADVLAGLIAIYSKYPFEIKKKLLFTSMESTSLPQDIFDKFPPSQLLSSSSLVTDIMRMKVPCNPNFLINIAIIDLLQEEQSMPFPLVQDQAKLFLKYLSAKSQKSLVIERLSPGPQTQDQLETLIRSGGIFVALDPDDEHMRLLRPIIDWQFRKFSENLILNNQQMIETTDFMIFFGKKITVHKQFYLYVVLEGMHVAKIEQSILSKLLVLDNSVMSETGFCETLGDELAGTLDSLARGYQVSEHTSNSLSGAVAQQYRVLLQKGRNFDFLRDSIESSGFLVFQNESSKFERTVKDYERDQETRRLALREYQSLQKELFKVVLPTIEDEREFHFLNCPFGYKIGDYIKLCSKHLKFASQFWPYFYALNLMRLFLGDSFSVGYDLLSHMVKQNLTSLEARHPLPADPDKKQEMLPALFNEAERQVYFSLKNCLPGRFQYIFSFLLSVITLQRKYSVGTQTFRRMSIMPMLGSFNLGSSGNFEPPSQREQTNTKNNSWTTLGGLSQLLNQFLWSERVLGRSTRSVPFSTSLYNKFNGLVKHLGGYYQDTQELLPMLLPRTKESCKVLSELTEQVDQAYNTAVDAFRDVDDQERLLSQLIGAQQQNDSESQSSDAENSVLSPLQSEPGSPTLKRYQSGTFESTQAEPSMKLGRYNSFEVRTSTSSRKDPPKFQMPGLDPQPLRKYLREVVPFYSAEGIARQLASELDFVYSDMKPREFGGQKLSFDQIVLVLKNLLSQLPQRTNLQLQIHSTGDPVVSLVPGLGTASPIGGAEAERRASKLLLASASGSKKKSGFQSMFFAGLSQASVQSKLVNLNQESRKSFKGFAQIIVEKNKAQKAAGTEFAQMFVDYIQEILSKVFGFNIKFTPEDLDWSQFLVGAKIPKGQTNPDYHDPECPPILPELPREVTSWHLMGKLAVVKYARPDWIESFLLHSYSEIKGKDYLYCVPTLDHIYLASTSKRCSVLLYQRIDRSPSASLEKLASKTSAKIFATVNALRISLEDFVTTVDNANKRGSWMIVENLHLVPLVQSTLMIKEAQTIIDKGASPGFRIWLLYKVERTQLEIGGSANQKNLPSWLSSCQYSFLDEADSVREELRHLLMHDFSTYSTVISHELSTNLGKMSISDLLLGGSKSQNSDENLLPIPAEPAPRSRLGSTSSAVIDTAIQERPAIQKPKIVVQLPSDMITGSLSATKGIAVPSSPSAKQSPLRGDSTSKVALAGNISRFGQAVGKPGATGNNLQVTNLSVQMPEPATPSKAGFSPSSPLAATKVQTDIISAMLRVNSTHAGTTFTNTQLVKRSSVILKMVSAIFRQRRKCVLELLGEETESWIEFTIPKDRQLDQMVSTILELANGPHSKDVLLCALRAFTYSFFGDTSRMNDCIGSPLLALQFLRALLIESPPRTDVHLEYSATRPYSIPSVYTAELPGKVLSENLLGLPTEDSLLFIGFRQNEQALIDFHRSKSCFAFLLERIGNRLDLQVPSPAGDAQGQTDNPQPTLSRNASMVQETPTGEAALDAQDNSQMFFLRRFIRDNKKHSKNIVGRFFLNHIEYGYNLILNHEFQGELKSDLRELLDTVLATLSDPMIGSIQGVVDLQTSQDQPKKQAYAESGPQLGRASSIGPGIVKSSSKIAVAANPYSPEEMLAKLGYKPNNPGKMYLVLNAQEQSIRSKGRRYLVAREWNILASLITFIKDQLKLARMSLVGDALLRHREHGRSLVESIASNKVPSSWLEQLRCLNVNTESFKSMIQSVLLRIDSLYSLAVDSYPKLPPIIHLGRLVSPHAFLMQVLQFNAQLHNVSMTDSVIMLFPKQSDKHKVYTNSTSWRVRGLKVRGGKVNEFGKLVPEEQGEYESDIGPVHLEITQFPKTHRRSIEGEPHIPIVLNTEFEEEQDPEESVAATLKKWLTQGEFSDPLVESRGSKEQLEYMATSLCPGSLRRQIPHSSEQASAAQTTRNKQSSLGGFSSALGVPGYVRDFGQVLKDTSSPFARTPTRGSVLGIAQKKDDAKPAEYKVRLPLESGLSYNPLTQMRFYVYFLSPRPHEYWISRASTVRFRE